MSTLALLFCEKSYVMEDKLALAQSLRAFRQSLNLTQTELADKIGATRSQYKNWEYGYASPPVNINHDKPSDGDGWGVIARLVGVIRSADGPERTWYWAQVLRVKDL